MSLFILTFFIIEFRPYITFIVVFSLFGFFYFVKYLNKNKMRDCKLKLNIKSQLDKSLIS